MSNLKNNKKLVGAFLAVVVFVAISLLFFSYKFASADIIENNVIVSGDNLDGHFQDGVINEGSAPDVVTDSTKNFNNEDVVINSEAGSATIIGKVIDSKREPLEGVKTTFVAADGTKIVGELSDAQGQYKIENVPENTSGTLSLEKDGYVTYKYDVEDTYQITNIETLALWSSSSPNFTVSGEAGAANPEYKKVVLFKKEFPPEKEVWKLVASADIKDDGSFEISNLDKYLIYNRHLLFLQISNDYASPIDGLQISSMRLKDDSIIPISKGVLKAKPYDQLIKEYSSNTQFDVERIYPSGRVQTFLPSLIYGFRDEYLDEYDVSYYTKENSIFFDFCKDGSLVQTFKITSNGQASKTSGWAIDGQFITPETKNIFDHSSKHTFTANFEVEKPVVPDDKETAKIERTVSAQTGDNSLIFALVLFVFAGSSILFFKRYYYVKFN